MLDNDMNTSATTGGPTPPADQDTWVRVEGAARAFNELTSPPKSTEATVVETVAAYWHQVDDWDGSLASFFFDVPAWAEIIVAHGILHFPGPHQDLFLRMLDSYAELTEEFAEQGGRDIALATDNQIWWRDRTSGALTVDVILNISIPDDLPTDDYTLAAEWNEHRFTVRLVAPALWCLRATWGPDGWTVEDSRPNPDTPWDEDGLCATAWKYPWR